MAGHRLGDGEYATRRDACRHAAELLGLESLRDVHDLPTALAALPTPRLRARVAHVVTENRRVLETVELLRSGAVAAIGPLLTASHRSLRDHYEVSWPEADVAVEEALRAGAAGARMVGGGFGGSVIALVHHDRVEAVAQAVTAAYAARDWTAPAFLQATAAPGARALSSLPDGRTHDSAASVFRR